jgi:putative copper export protein
MPRLTRIAGPVALLTAAFIAILVSLSFGGGAAAPLLLDPGPVVRYGLSISKLLVNLGAAGTIGSLVLVCFALDFSRPEFSKALDVAAASAAVWTVASGFTALYTFLTVFTQPIQFDDAFGELLGRFLTTTELGQAWLITMLIAASVTVLCFAVRNQTALVFVTVIAAAGVLPIAVQGHQGGTAEHDSASTATFLHVVFAGVWLGGLLTLALLRPQLEGSRLVTVMKRYSTLALVSFIVVAISGYVSAAIRVDDLQNLLSPYGILVLVKVAVLLVLGLLGAGRSTGWLGRPTAPAAGSGRSFRWNSPSWASQAVSQRPLREPRRPCQKCRQPSYSTRRRQNS